MEASLPALCFLLSWMYVVGLNQPVMIPPEIQNIMAGVSDMASFLKAMKLGNVSLGTAEKVFPPTRNIKPMKREGQGLAVGRVSNIKSLYKFGRSKVLSLGDMSGPPVALENIACNIIPEVVAVPQPRHSHGFYFPTHVRLYRCAGACSAMPRVLECAPTETKNISLLVFSVGWSPSPSGGKSKWYRTPLVVQMTNHTECGCRCVTKPSECNPRTQFFKKEYCRCECKPRAMPCQRFFQWDRIQCRCRCNPYHIPTCPSRQEWHNDVCKCGCKRNKCKVRAKVRHPRTCHCQCPELPRCASGLRKGRSDCKCKPISKWRRRSQR